MTRAIYKHQGKGHYIGSCVMVIADDEEFAKTQIRYELDNMGLCDEPITTLDVVPLHKRGTWTIYFDSGDY